MVQAIMTLASAPLPIIPTNLGFGAGAEAVCEVLMGTMIGLIAKFGMDKCLIFSDKAGGS